MLVPLLGSSIRVEPRAALACSAAASFNNNNIYPAPSSMTSGEVLGKGVVQWRRSTLEDTGLEYWWRPPADTDEAAELALSRPPDSWRLALLSSGRPYLWRENSADPEDPEVRLWRRSALSCGRPFWYTEEGKVSLEDPFDLAAGYTEL